MKILSKGLTLMNFLFVLASFLHDAENAELNSNEKDFYPNFDYGQSKKTIFQKPFRRISQTKCMEYIEELNYSASRVLTGLGVNGNGLTEVGGRDAYPGEFPHMGALGWRTRSGGWKFHCGSSVISHKFLLTAAHCSKIPSNGDIVNEVPEIVRLSTNIIDELHSYIYAVDAYILRIITYPEYSSPKVYYDIALIELKSDLQFNRYLHPVCLWSNFDISRLRNFTSSGWGVIDPEGRITTTTLQVIEIDIIKSEVCNDLLHQFCNRKFCLLREHQLCAGKLAGGVDSCQGDSGGPLQVKVQSHISQGVTMHYLVGITSFGKECARPNRPGVYTRVSSFIDWIENIVWRKY